MPPPDIPVGRVTVWKGHLPTVLRPESLPQLSSEDKHFSPESRGGMLMQEEREGGLFDGSRALIYIVLWECHTSTLKCDPFIPIFPLQFSPYPIPPYASLLFSVSSLWIQLVPPVGARLWTEWETTLECWKPTSGCSLQESPSGWFLLLQWSKHQQCTHEVMYFLIHEEKLWPVGKGGELIVVYAGPCSQAFLISRVSSLTSYFLCIIETSSQITLLFPFLNDIISFSSQGPIFLVKAEFLHLACLSLLIFFFLKNFFTLTPNNPFLNCLKFKEPCRSC